VRVFSGPLASGSALHTLTATRSATSWSVDAPALADGTYTARVAQSDSGGHTRFSAAHTFTVDTVAPAVTLTSPADLSSGSDDTPALQGTSSESGQVTVRIHAGASTAGAVVQTRTATVSNGSWSVDALQLADNTYTAKAEQSDPAGNVGASGAHRFSVPATLLAAGDIADCGNDNDEATAALADSRPGTVAPLGDLAYEDGTAAEFNACYHPTWGRHKARTKPSPGNHEYHDPGAAGYFGYFGAAAGNAGEGWYSYNLGDWHIVVLNSSDDCVTVACGPTSPQVQWLRADLDAHANSCTLAYWHHPRFTSELPNHTSVQAFWDVLYEKNADLILNGHAHNYERYKPQTPAGDVDAVRGIRQFIVGTGGRSLRPIATQDANSEVAQWSTFGILKLALRASSYSWEFLPAAGPTFTDSGTTACH
jgi:Bacterial Ig-like domain/Calcineurin-like phosphoesterase